MSASPHNRIVSAVSGGLVFILIFLVRGYQTCISPLLIGSCRFAPTCSEYFIAAVRRHGPWRGVWLGLWRLARCHPLSPGGLDPVPH